VAKKKITGWQIFTGLGILSNQQFMRIAQVADAKFQLKVETQASNISLTFRLSI
jgi:hypothetical protein